MPEVGRRHQHHARLLPTAPGGFSGCVTSPPTAPRQVATSKLFAAMYARALQEQIGSGGSQLHRQVSPALTLRLSPASAPVVGNHLVITPSPPHHKTPTGVSAFAVHPGLIRSDIYGKVPDPTPRSHVPSLMLTDHSAAPNDPNHTPSAGRLRGRVGCSIDPLGHLPLRGPSGIRGSARALLRRRPWARRHSRGVGGLVRCGGGGRAGSRPLAGNSDSALLYLSSCSLLYRRAPPQQRQGRTTGCADGRIRGPQPTLRSMLRAHA